MINYKPLNKIWQNIVIISILILFLSSAMLNGNRFKEDEGLTLILEVLWALSGIALLLSVFKLYIKQYSQSSETIIILGQFVCCGILGLSMIILTNEALRNQNKIMLIATICSVISGIGLMILTLIHAIIKSRSRIK